MDRGTIGATMRLFIIAYAAAFVVMGILDGLWLSLTVRKLYRPAMGALMADKPIIPAAIAFYLLYVAGLTLLVVLPALAANQLGVALSRGAVLGLTAYVTYDLTNLAIIRDWPLSVTLTDLAWGTLLTALTAAAAFLIAHGLA
jgi:uncharacterized membrane protein